MVENGRLLESRRFLKLVYLTILFLISLVIVIIILIFVENERLLSDDETKYQEIIVEVEEIKQKIDLTQTELNSIESQLQVASDDLQKRQGLLTRYIDANKDLSKYSLGALRKLVETENLRLKSENYETIKVYTEYFEKLEIIATDSANSAEKEQNIVLFYKELNTALDCYTKIDTNKNSSSIEGASIKCQLNIKNATSLIKQYNKDLEMTFQYLDIIANYWEVTVKLHQAIEKQDEKQTTTLRAELNNLQNEIDQFTLKSSEEIKNFLNEN